MQQKRKETKQCLINVRSLSMGFFIFVGFFIGLMCGLSLILGV